MAILLIVIVLRFMRTLELSIVFFFNRNIFSRRHVGDPVEHLFKITHFL